MNSPCLVDWKAREIFKSLVMVDMGGGISFITRSVRSGCDGREFGREVIQEEPNVCSSMIGHVFAYLIFHVIF